MGGCCSLSIWFLVAFTLNSGCTRTATHGLQRSKRFLIFPRQAPTRYQFIGGIGIPADLDYESLTVGHVLKAEYWLPYNATVFRENPFWPEYKSKYNSTNPTYIYARESRQSTLRWNLYSYIADRLESYGYNGMQCVLKAICEANILKFQQQHSVFEKIMHILLSPSTSADKPTAVSALYKEAEKIGGVIGDCNFYKCKLSLIDWISSVLQVE
ncbi:uncharacterized protein LOC101451689 [Ceratitis capitata]|uniref:uncharacterized protein LOC101451689 n=1 Tax=Ceratitis capitata TaxID=7213 RepID=UPI000329BB70|nr:uncharacterized protein LOC101451689 [Ceratitis capitata]